MTKAEEYIVKMAEKSANLTLKNLKDLHEEFGEQLGLNKHGFIHIYFSDLFAQSIRGLLINAKDTGVADAVVTVGEVFDKLPELIKETSNNLSKRMN